MVIAKLLSVILILQWIFTLVTCTPTLQPATPFFIFPNNQQPENLRPRSNGQLLVTVNTVPELYQINPFCNQTGGPVARFPGYTSLFGIVELKKDIFYVTALNYTGAPDYYGFQGSVAIFQVDLRKISNLTIGESPSAIITKIVDVSSAQLLDGMDVINKRSGLLISGDAQTGTLWLINVPKRTATAVLKDTLLDGVTDERAAALAHIGINGVKVRGSFIYFTNTAIGTYGRISINRTTGTPTGVPIVLDTYGGIVDDLNFDRLGNQFISLPLDGLVFRPVDATPANNRTQFLTRLFGINSNAFGRTWQDRCVLYMTFVGNPSGLAKIDTKEKFCNDE